MEIRHKVAITSSWEVSGCVRSVLYIRNRSTGILLDEPLSSERPSSTPLTLTAPTSSNDQPCFLYVDLSGLGGYLPLSLQLISESRTVEAYDRSSDEYLATARGPLTKDPNDDVKLYDCEFSLPSNTVPNKIALKLLSLKGKTQVSLSKLIMDVSEDHSGSQDGPPSKPSTNLSQHQQFLSSLSSQNLPPFLKQLVSSLQSVSAKDNSTTATPDLTLMSSAFRQVHTALAPAVVESEPAVEDSVSKETSVEGHESVPSADTASAVTLSQAEQDRLLARLEDKLMHYIDTKFAELEQKIEARLEKLSNNQLVERNCEASRDLPDVNGYDSSTHPDNLVEDSFQLD